MEVVRDACHLSYECLALRVKPDPWETQGVPSTFAGKAKEPTKVRVRVGQVGQN